MFIANDSNYTFGQFLAVDNGDDIKAPVYSKCFTDTEALKGFRFVHDPEETDPEKCVCFSIYNETSSAALSTPFEEFASVSDLTSVSFRLDTEIVEGVLREVPYYHVIVPVQNIKDDTLKYLVIKMTKEVELFPENYPYYELVSSFEDAEPTSAEAPGGGVTPTGTITITENDTYDVTNYASANVNVSSDYSTCTVTFVASSEGDYQNPDGICVYETMPMFGEDAILMPSYVEYGENLPTSVTAVLINGTQTILSGYIGTGSPVVSGNAEFNEQYNTIIISGDCTIKAFTIR